jgi:hypothetical protein
VAPSPWAGRGALGPNGRCRWNNDHELPDWAGGGTITVRLHQNDTDKRRGLNRTENLRPIPPEDPDFEALYARRNDAESINRHLEDTLWLNRAHSIGNGRQHLWRVASVAVTASESGSILGTRCRTA